MRKLAWTAWALAMLAVAPDLSARESSRAKEVPVRNVIYMIGDGMGLTHVSMMMLEEGYRPPSFARSQNVALLTPYSAIFVISGGVLLSNFAFISFAMRRPFVGAPVSYRAYFRGSLPPHLVGMLGGAVWCLGTAFSYIAAGKAGAAISYALGQGAPMIAAVWGVFIWKEFKGADRKTNTLLAVMFLFFIAGLASIIASGGN